MDLSQFHVILHQLNYNYNQAYSEYKHSLTFCVRGCVVTATKPEHRLQIRPTVHNYKAPRSIPPSYIWIRVQ